MNGNMIADLVGFIAATIGGYVFREEISVSAAFTQEFLGKWWDIGAKWYSHSVARGVRNVLALEFFTSGAIFFAWSIVASTSGVTGNSAWWLLPFGAAIVLLFVPNLLAIASFVGVGALDLNWFVRQVQAVQTAENLVEALRRSAEERCLNKDSHRYFVERRMRVRSALNHLRAQLARRQLRQPPPTQRDLQTARSRITMHEFLLAGFDAIIGTWNQQNETGSEFSDPMHSIVLSHFEQRQRAAGFLGDAFVLETRRRSGRRAPRVVLPSLVAILAPQVSGVLLLLASVLLVGLNGLNWFTFFSLGIMSYLVYFQGQVALNLVSATVVKVLVDGGDVFNRLLNSIVLRPGLVVLPGVTSENYDKMIGGDINLPFKAVGEAAKLSTNRTKMIIDRIFGWVLLAPSIYTFGFVTLSGWYVPYMAAMHRQANLDDKSFLKKLANAEIATKYTGYVVRLIQFFLAMFGIVFEPAAVWNTFAGWSNHLIDSGVMSLAMAGLVIVGGVGTMFFMGKHDTAKTKVAQYPLLALASAFALLAVLPLVGWLSSQGGVHLNVPTVPTSVVHADVPHESVAVPHVSDSIDAMTGAATPPTTPVTVPTSSDTLGVVPVPPLPVVGSVSAPTRTAHPECEGLTPRFLDRMRDRGLCP